jgi:cardiolipin synthase
MMQSKALSLPNLLTYARIIMVPVVAGLVMWGGAFAHWLALGIFIIAAITDFFDGWLARRWQLQSSLGRMLDPIADKLLVAAALHHRRRAFMGRYYHPVPRSAGLRLA